MLLEVKQLDIPPGQKICLRDINWEQFEQILEELGEHSKRIAYGHCTLEIMTPLPEHESNKEIIGDLIKILLEKFDREFYPLGSTTLKNRLMGYGIEPDNCFYIEHEAQIRGKDRIDLTVDPLPDLALEIDVTSRTHPGIYQKLGVPELWCFAKGKLTIKVLENGEYQEVQFSPHFPNLPLQEVIPEYLSKVKIEGRNKAIKAFRSWLRGWFIEDNLLYL